MNDTSTTLYSRPDLPRSPGEPGGSGPARSILGSGLRLLGMGTLLLSLGCAGSDPMGPGDPTLPVLAVTTASLPDGAVDVAYGTQTLHATGGDGTYAWSLASGRQPDGLSVAANGVITGTPTAVETRSFTVQVRSGDGQMAQRALSISVTAPPMLQPNELCSDHPGAARATFEDAGLEAAVRGALDVDAQGELTCATLATLERLDARGLGISSLVGIQNLTGLWDLEIGGNEITDIGALSGLTDLTGLDLFDNAITDVSALAGMTDLGFLNLNANAVTDLTPLSGLTDMEILFLGNNAITDIGPLRGLDALWNLSLEGNPITDIGALNGLMRLTDLRLGSTSIADYGPLAGVTGLEYLDLAGSGISDLTALGGVLSGHAGLWHLGLSDNAITDLGPLGGLGRLTYLGLSNNAFTDIGALSGLTHLVKLFLTENAITDVSALEALTDLSYLGLSGNEDLVDIQPLLDNQGLGAGVAVTLSRTNVGCGDVAALRAKHVTVHAPACGS